MYLCIYVFIAEAFSIAKSDNLSRVAIGIFFLQLNNLILFVSRQAFVASGLLDKTVLSEER
jgi:hypothetical protein